MYEPITVQIDRGYGKGTYRSYNINFTGRLVKTIQAANLTMTLYEWVDRRGYLVYLVHVEEEKPRQLPRHSLYPFINTYGRFRYVLHVPMVRLLILGQTRGCST